MTFPYTASDRDVDSSVVYEAYYDSVRKRLAVVLDSGYAYAYDNVPQSVYDDLTSGNYSAGRLYAKTVKREYGPGENLGYVGFDNEDEFVESVPAADMSSTYTPLVDAYNQAAATTGGGKALTYSSNAVVDGKPVVSISGQGTFVNLNQQEFAGTEPKPAVLIHVVHFTVEDGNEVKTYSVDTDSVAKAVDGLAEVANTLGVNVTVKGVYVHFE